MIGEKVYKLLESCDFDIKSVERVDEEFPVILSDYIISQIKSHKSEGLIRQFIPTPDELKDEDGAGAFFDDEKHIAGNNIPAIQKYPNRCIIYATSLCFANCRHCSRKAKWKEHTPYSRLTFDEVFLALAERSYIEEVIITGGDALTIPIAELDYMLSKISKLHHVKAIRIGTRAFTSNPKIITTELCSILEKYTSIIMCTQFNHPDEFSVETEDALLKIQKTGIPVLNQATLLKNVNDNYDTMKALLTKCATNRVIPYYLFHCFKVKGTQCFRTNVQTGIDLVNQLVGNVGGWWIPRYILIPHTTGVKVPVCPNGIESWESDTLYLEDYRGRIIKYE